VSRGTHRTLVALPLLLAMAVGCGADADELFCDDPACLFTPEEWSRLATLSPLPKPPLDHSNRYADDLAAQALGRAFYFDPRFSGVATLVDAVGRPVSQARAPFGEPIGISCATCHDPTLGGGDATSVPRTVSIGAGWYDVNGQQTLNAAHFGLLYWNGRSDSLWSQAAAVAESKVSMNGSRLNTFWVVLASYRDAYNGVFGATSGSLSPLGAVDAASIPLEGRPGDPRFDNLTIEDKELVTRVFVNWAKAIAAYETTLVSRHSPFDAFVADGRDSTWISPAAKRGARLFVGKASCIDCHDTPLLSDGEFHDVGVPQKGDHVPTVADCLAGNAACDCTPGAEGASCLPAGAWAGLQKLAANVDTTDAIGQRVINFNNFRRDSVWSDSVEGAPTELYKPPTDVRLKGAWRTPSLRDVALTPPYMHDGVYATLTEVVRHYDSGGEGPSPFLLPPCAAVDDGKPCTSPGAPAPAPAVQLKPLRLSERDISDLVEFLLTLTSRESSGPP
jgi:cytochrome c peroxidase